MKISALAAIAGFTAIAAAGLAATANAAQNNPGNTPYSAFLDGNELGLDCKGAGTDTFGGGACIGYIVGTVDALAFIPGMGLCLPPGVSRGQARDIVIQYLRDHPAERHYIAASTVTAALWKAFPCPTKPGVTS